MKCIEFRVIGRVQGVFYRASTVDYVMKSGLNITGYVRNMPNGDVEVLAQGDEADLDQLYLWLKKGPDMARVIEVKIKTLDHYSTYDGFKVMY